MNSDKEFALDIRWPFCSHKKYKTAFVLLFVILLTVYSNSFSCSWHHDDFGNIVNNPHIKIQNLSWTEIEKSLYGITPSDLWSRPFAYFSFAVNYYLGGLDVFGYHVVNFLVHYLSSLILFLFIYNTLQLPLLANRYAKYAYSISLLATVLWAIHPIQVTAVTYIVQRMASLAALFYILSMYFFMKGRTAQKSDTAAILYFFCFVSFLLALAAKQNAAMLPVSLVVYDLLLIQGVNKRNIFKTVRLLAIPTVIAVAIVVLFIMLDPSMFEFQQRIFTRHERLLTQPRVFFFYISLLLYPLTSRLMLIHYMDVSKSLLHPWTTVAAFAGLIGVLAFSVWKAKKLPLLSFCILFFFLNHLIEGSFISLELIYEHRNYLPSMFFFLPISIGILNVIDKFTEKRVVFLAMVTAVITIMTIFGVTVYIQNTIYKDEMTLWIDNAQKMPNLHTPHQYLGNVYMKAGRIQDAYLEYQKALQSLTSGNIYNKSATYERLAIYYLTLHDLDKSLYSVDEAIKIAPRRDDLHNLRGVILLDKSDKADAEKSIRKAIAIDRNKSMYHTNLGTILFMNGRYDVAFRESQEALRLNPDSWQAYFLMSAVFKKKGNDAIANHFHRIGQQVLAGQQTSTAEDDLYSLSLSMNISR